MPKFRYHIHVIEVSGNQPHIDSQVALFLENRAFVTRDLLLVTDETANYSRRCIDACDFVIMIVSDSYGNTNISGVSQMHLSYLTVKTKRKPLLILIKSPSHVERSRQLLDFIDTVEQRGPQQLYYFQDLQSFTEVLTQSYRTMCEIVPNQSWVKDDSIKLKGMPSVTDSIVRFGDIKKRDKNDLSTLLSDIDLVGDANNVDDKGFYNHHSESILSNVLPSKVDNHTLETNVVYKNPMAKQSSERSFLGKISDDKDIINQHKDYGLASNLESSISTNTSKNTNSSHSISRIESQVSYQLSQGPLKQVSLDQLVDLTYDAHAYQDGNIKDVTITTSVTWLQILHALEQLSDIFSSDTMYRALNEEVARSASESVAKVLPKAHAVSRCLIRQTDFVWVQDQMVFNGWLRLVNQHMNSRDSWQLTDKALKVLLSER